MTDHHAIRDTTLGLIVARRSHSGKCSAKLSVARQASYSSTDNGGLSGTSADAGGVVLLLLHELTVAQLEEVRTAHLHEPGPPA